MAYEKPVLKREQAYLPLPLQPDFTQPPYPELIAFFETTRAHPILSTDPVPIQAPHTHYCTRCEQVLSMDSFYTVGSKIRNQCKECIREAERIRYDRRKEKEKIK